MTTHSAFTMLKSYNLPRRTDFGVKPYRGATLDQVHRRD